MQSSLCSLLGLRRFIHKHHPVKNSIYHAIPRVSYYGDNRTKGEPRPKVSEERIKSYASEFTHYASGLHRAGALIPKSLSEVIKEREKSEAHWRIPMSGLFGEEVSRVLGGGLVPGSSVLIGGTPGVGKNTFSLQAAVTLAERGGGPVIYVSGEESITQIADRAIRMGISKKDILLCSNTNIEDILEKSRKMDPNPTALIIDSIQTTYMRGLHESAGNPTQFTMKRCMAALLQYANETNIPVIVTGHVTKMGTLAGPRTLEHMVDVVLYVETLNLRLLRCVKNRFGSTDELGIFEMSKTGLQVALNTRDMFSRDPDPEATILAGHAFGVMIDESRTSIVEVQALCFSIPHGKVKVQVNGVQKTRANQIITVISMQTALTPKNCIYLNVLSGVQLSGSAVDLPIAAAICSGCFGYPIPNDIAFIGEIGLEGELRTVPRIDKRVKAVANLEFKKCIVPKESKKLLDELDLNIKILYCKNLIEMIETVFPFTKEKKYDSESGLMKKGI